MTLRYCARSTEGAFHLRWYPAIREFYPVIDWTWQQYSLQCWAQDEPGIRSMSRRIADVQREVRGHVGGRFLIDEFNRIVIPGNGPEPVFGGMSVSHPILFHNPLTGGWIDLACDQGLQTGDLWNKPYVGLVYKLGANRMIRFDDPCGSEYPPRQDPKLVQLLSDVRPGGGKFLVNPYGIVLTKKPIRTGHIEEYVPVFVGRINRQCWFEM